jgi:hypothetical protein
VRKVIGGKNDVIDKALIAIFAAIISGAAWPRRFSFVGPGSRRVQSDSVHAG